MNIGLFYGSSTCYTEMAAEKIRDFIGEELVTLHNLKDDDPSLMEQYDLLILGIPTWDFGELQEDWEAVWPQLPGLNLQGKIVALYGMGDQIEYSEWFLDALGMLHELLLLFADSLTEIETQLLTALSEGDWTSASRHCHKLRGEAAIFGFTDLTHTLQAAETQIRRGDAIDAARLRANLIQEWFTAPVTDSQPARCRGQ